MNGVNQDILFYQGDSRQLVVTVYNSQGTAIPITGAFIRYVIYQDQSVVVTKTTTNGGVVLTDPSAGVFTVYLTPTDTGALRGSYNHMARMIDTSGDSSIIMTGTVTVDQSFA